MTSGEIWNSFVCLCVLRLFCPLSRNLILIYLVSFSLYLPTKAHYRIRCNLFIFAAAYIELWWIDVNE